MKVRRGRQRALQAKIGRGYDDYVESRISDALWKRKSAEWETELATGTAELSALDRPITSFVATGLFARATETGEWRGVWDDFRNWLVSST